MERGRIVVSYERFGEFSGRAAELTPEEDADFRKRRKQLGMQEWDEENSASLNFSGFPSDVEQQRRRIMEDMNFMQEQVDFKLQCGTEATLLREQANFYTEIGDLDGARILREQADDACDRQF